MRAKLFSLLSLSVLFLVMFIGVVSAEVIFSPNPVVVEGNQGELVEVNFTIDNTYAGDIIDMSFIFSNLIQDSFNIPSTNLIIELPEEIEGESDLELTLKIQIPSEQEAGIYEGNAEFWAAITSDPSLRETLNISLTVTEVIIEPEDPEEIEACKLVGEGSLEIDITDITVINGFGDDEEWLPFDEIEIEIEIENTNDDEKIKDITIEWGLWSEETNEWVIELDEVDEFDLKKDSDKIITVNFKLNKKKLEVDLDELEEGDYILYVIANGEEQEDTEFDVCSFNSEAVKIFIESDFIILNNFELNGFPLENDVAVESVQCNTDIEITADVWNIGDRDQDDVYIIVYNKELGIINEKIEIGDIDAFEDEKLVFNFKVPQDLEEKWYNLEFRIYDEDDDLYENDYDDEQAEFLISLKVEGSCIIEPQINVIPNVESGGKAGEELVIKAIITNTGDDDLVTYELDVVGYTDWAELISIEPSTITLNAGESKDVLITFNVNNDASGKESSFDIIFSGDVSATQHIQGVTIEKPATGFGFLTGNIISEGNWYLWAIGALNIILVIVIVLVAVRVAKKE